MAIGKASDLVIYNDEFYGGFVETLQQETEGFNAASNNTIQLISEGHEGDYQKEAFYDVVSSLVGRRDTTSVSSQTDTALTADELIGVKLNRKVKPISQALDAWRKIGKTNSELSYVVGKQMAKAIAQDKLERALSALQAKLDATSALEVDKSGTGGLLTEYLVQALAKAGDKGKDIACWFMHSNCFYELMEDQIADTGSVYSAVGAQILTGSPATLGRPVVVTDSSYLKITDGVSSGVDKYSTLGLFRGAAVVKESERLEVVTDLVTGLENLAYRLQGEYAFTLSLRGCEYKTATGANPSDANVATGSNWTTQVADNKLLPGVIVLTK